MTKNYLFQQFYSYWSQCHNLCGMNMVQKREMLLELVSRIQNEIHYSFKSNSKRKKVTIPISNIDGKPCERLQELYNDMNLDAKTNCDGKTTFIVHKIAKRTYNYALLIE